MHNVGHRVSGITVIIDRRQCYSTLHRRRPMHPSSELVTDDDQCVIRTKDCVFIAVFWRCHESSPTVRRSVFENLSFSIVAIRAYVRKPRHSSTTFYWFQLDSRICRYTSVGGCLLTSDLNSARNSVLHDVRRVWHSRKCNFPFSWPSDVSICVDFMQHFLYIYIHLGSCYTTIFIRVFKHFMQWYFKLNLSHVRLALIISHNIWP